MLSSRGPIEITCAGTVEASPQLVYAWHLRPGAVRRLLPPWVRIRLLGADRPLETGEPFRLEFRWGPLPLRMELRCAERGPGERFRLEQVRGPFSAWEHVRELHADGARGCKISDRIRVGSPIRLRLGGRLDTKVRRILHTGYAQLGHDLRSHARYGGASLRVVVSGASGLVGSALVPFLTAGGHRVERLVRRTSPADAAEIPWDPLAGTLDRDRLEGCDTVVHLAGEGIGEGRWTRARKQAIRQSRVDGTRTLCGALAALRSPPRLLVSASAVGFYGDRGEESLTEESPRGEGFLADVCREWEAATEPAARAGIRVVNLRIGVVLARWGGALARMLLPFRLGLGGPVGSGAQFLSWVGLPDLIGVIHHAMVEDALSGPVNAVAPEPVPQAEFARTLGRVLRRPALVPLPAFAVRLALGEMGEALLLEGARVLPRKLLDSGFEFRAPDLEPMLRLLVGTDSRRNEGAG